MTSYSTLDVARGYLPGIALDPSGNDHRCAPSYVSGCTWTRDQLPSSLWDSPNSSTRRSRCSASGTAAANFLPAIIEAKLMHVALLVLTADRPHELRDCGAPQAINQNQLYGTHTKWFMDVVLPKPPTRPYAISVPLRSARQSHQGRARRTCHLNLTFHEPFTPEPWPDQPLPSLAMRDEIAWQGRVENAPYISVHFASPGFSSLCAQFLRRSGLGLQSRSTVCTDAMDMHRKEAR
ncbi:thiamine pyrophosphate-binding protein [Ktedonosporobacter rubrisoli]|uniref:thiamine pyrophosphate-binding protein n=1 Tax=Ktedonosporobacter rubrisoli TaxID=2509675 RepID=UPI001A928A25|nr:thiamine pyrophosphate-binding protein [Ktedonosporobacter rubrisoli]